MANPQPLVFDSIIFGLQRFGGISNQWARLLDFAATCSALAPHLVLPRDITFQDYNDAWAKRMPSSTERIPARFARYLPAPVPDATAVFHTSYYRLPRRRTSRYVVSAYDFTYERYRSGLARQVHSAQKFASLRRADAILCNSHTTRGDVLTFCPEIDAARIHVTHLGVDTATFHAGGESVCGHESTVLFVGHRAGYKRFDLAVEAIRQSPRLSLGVVGPALNDAERTMLRERLGTRWHEFGAVSTPTLRSLYCSVFAFIFPSDYEGFGLPVLEAMACGCPVVAANASSLPEVGGNAAHYAAAQRGEDYAAALQKLDAASTRAACVAAGHLRAAQFTWARMFEETLPIYLGST